MAASEIRGGVLIRSEWLNAAYGVWNIISAALRLAPGAVRGAGPGIDPPGYLTLLPDATLERVDYGGRPQVIDVSLRRGEAGVAERSLDDSDVDLLIRHPGSEGMP